MQAAVRSTGRPVCQLHQPVLNGSLYEVNVVKFLRRLWRDQRAETSAIGTILLYTVLVLGATVGLVTFRNQLVQEFGDLATALQSLDQSFSIDGKASFEDTTTLSDPAGAEPAGLNVQVSSTPEGA